MSTLHETKNPSEKEKGQQKHFKPGTDARDHVNRLQFGGGLSTRVVCKLWSLDGNFFLYEGCRFVPLNFFS